MLKQFLLVGLGGAIGSVLRYGCTLIYTGKSFPLTTFFINILGSFIIGTVIGFSIKNESFSNHWKLFFATGVCGGFTTFSAFSIENMHLLQEGKFLLSLLYSCASIVLGITAAWMGFKLIA